MKAQWEEFWTHSELLVKSDGRTYCPNIEYKPMSDVAHRSCRTLRANRFRLAGQTRRAGHGAEPHMEETLTG